MVSNIGADRTSSQRRHWVPGAVTRAAEVLWNGPWLALVRIEERAVHICFEYRIDSASCVLSAMDIDEILGTDCLTTATKQAGSVVSGAVCQEGCLRGIDHQVWVVMNQILDEGIKGECEDDSQATPDGKMPDNC